MVYTATNVQLPEGGGKEKKEKKKEKKKKKRRDTYGNQEGRSRLDTNAHHHISSPQP